MILLILIVLGQIMFQKGLKHLSVKKNIKSNIFRIQVYDSIMCGYFCARFIDFMLAGETLTEFTSLFSTNNFKRNDNITLEHFINNV